MTNSQRCAGKVGSSGATHKEELVPIQRPTGAFVGAALVTARAANKPTIIASFIMSALMWSVTVLEGGSFESGATCAPLYCHVRSGIFISSGKSAVFI